MLLEGNRHELRFTGLGELLFQRGTFPFKGEEGFLDGFLQFRLQVVGDAVTGGGKGLGLVEGDDLVVADHVPAQHPVKYRVGDGCGRVILVGDAQDRVIVLTGKYRLEVFAGDHVVVSLEDGGRRLETGVGRLGSEGQFLAANILHILNTGIRVGDDFHFIAERAVFRSHHGERSQTGAGDCQRVGTGIEAGNVQATGAHRLDLGGVGLNREELHLLAGGLREVIKELGPDFPVDGRILHGRVGKDQGRGIHLL